MDAKALVKRSFVIGQHDIKTGPSVTIPEDIQDHWLVEHLVKTGQIVPIPPRAEPEDGEFDEPKVPVTPAPVKPAKIPPKGPTVTTEPVKASDENPGAEE